MFWLVRFAVAVVALVGLLAFSGSQAKADSTCVDGVQDSGALYRICVPDDWNGDLALWAHGYVSPFSPLSIPDDTLPDGTPISDVITGLGFGYATTSYSKNGLAVKQGVADIVDLVDIFEDANGQADRVFAVGGSEGGIVTTLAVEGNPDVFDGGIAACGPIGDFQRQINYIGDFRLIFDFLFPDVLPGNALFIPQELIDNWDAVYVPAIEQAIAADSHATEQLLAVTRAPTDVNDPDTIAETVVGVLWYNVFATTDGIETLGGQPFDNSRRLYRGSDNDLVLNLLVPRIQADPDAVAELEAYYQTSGELSDPLVTLHTTGDQIVPYWHEPLYRAKLIQSGDTGLHMNMRVERYGHCNFTAGEAIVALVRLLILGGNQG